MHGAFMKNGKRVMSSFDEPSPQVLGHLLGLGSITCGDITCRSMWVYGLAHYWQC